MLAYYFYLAGSLCFTKEDRRWEKHTDTKTMVK